MLLTTKIYLLTILVIASAMTAHATIGYRIKSSAPCYYNGPKKGGSTTIPGGSRGIIGCQITGGPADHGVKVWDYLYDWNCYINDYYVDTCGKTSLCGMGKC